MTILPPIKQRHSPNFSTRGGATVRLLVYHESAGHYQSDIDWLCNPAAQASAHAVLREDGNELTQLVKLADKAWHCYPHFNPVSVGIEHSNLTAKGYATEHQLQESARLYAWLSLHLNIPVRFARGGVGTGFCRHLDLGELGGGHTQCGMGDHDFARWLHMVYNERKSGGFRTKYMS